MGVADLKKNVSVSMPKPTAYRIVGVTHDGVRVIAPKNKSANFTEEEVREYIRKALPPAHLPKPT